MTIIFLILNLALNISTNKIMNEKKYLALGDSYTIGEGVKESERYPIQLKDKLKEAGINLNEVNIIAKTGWTTDELNAAIDKQNPNSDYDLVTLLIGVNNQYRGRDTANYRDEFAALLERAIGFTSSKENVIVISIPDWGVTPFAKEKGKDQQQVTAEINIFNKINLEETLKRNIKYVDVTDISREALNDLSILAEDGLHPSGKMYSLWVDRIYPIAKSILE
ncbi:MAG: SGNH/GDSL hydrolase family protein [Melioribacteraceae bacterium]|nr:SGNH/GDSL hydrolase family protein [Melioribacteraceae bacterium]